MPRRRSTRLRRTLRLNARNSPGDATVLKWNMIALRDIGFRADVARIMYDSSKIARYATLSLFPFLVLGMFLVKTLVTDSFMTASRSEHLAFTFSLRDLDLQFLRQMSRFPSMQHFVQPPTCARSMQGFLINHRRSRADSMI